MKILFLGDVVGVSGCSKLLSNLKNEIESKKINFVIFDPKESWSRLGLGWISRNPAKLVENDLTTLYSGCLWIKSRNFVTIVWSCEKWQAISWPMGWIRPPPAVFRVKSLIYYFLQTSHVVVLVSSISNFFTNTTSLANKWMNFSSSNSALFIHSILYHFFL